MNTHPAYWMETTFLCRGVPYLSNNIGLQEKKLYKNNNGFKGVFHGSEKNYWGYGFWYLLEKTGFKCLKMGLFFNITVFVVVESKSVIFSMLRVFYILGDEAYIYCYVYGLSTKWFPFCLQYGCTPGGHSFNFCKWLCVTDKFYHWALLGWLTSP